MRLRGLDDVVEVEVEDDVGWRGGVSVDEEEAEAEG